MNGNVTRIGTRGDCVIFFLIEFVRDSCGECKKCFFFRYTKCVDKIVHAKFYLCKPSCND